uniref:Uncharacterized protein n=1 Tax=Cyprinus carpio carpio TaxID=630221 RepID=A0A9J7WYH6_CYPCA
MHVFVYIYIYIINIHSTHTHTHIYILCKEKLLFWMRLITINHLTAIKTIHYISCFTSLGRSEMNASSFSGPLQLCNKQTEPSIYTYRHAAPERLCQSHSAMKRTK